MAPVASRKRPDKKGICKHEWLKGRIELDRAAVQTTAIKAVTTDGGQENVVNVMVRKPCMARTPQKLGHSLEFPIILPHSVVL